ncbi:MAG: hypothetical protein PHF29_04495 [Candidatus Riflebacteria bacterium]|nr:hypothetical protein [Candidatus Riflebacteria bacterium]
MDKENANELCVTKKMIGYEKEIAFNTFFDIEKQVFNSYKPQLETEKDGQSFSFSEVSVVALYPVLKKTVKTPKNDLLLYRVSIIANYKEIIVDEFEELVLARALGERLTSMLKSKLKMSVIESDCFKTICESAWSSEREWDKLNISYCDYIFKNAEKPSVGDVKDLNYTKITEDGFETSVIKFKAPYVFSGSFPYIDILGVSIILGTLMSGFVLTSQITVKFLEKISMFVSAKHFVFFASVMFLFFLIYAVLAYIFRVENEIKVNEKTFVFTQITKFGKEVFITPVDSIEEIITDSGKNEIFFHRYKRMHLISDARILTFFIDHSRFNLLRNLIDLAMFEAGEKHLSKPA